MTDQRTRERLRERFKTGAQPSEQDFSDLIHSVLNIEDDGLEKPPGVDTPLKILAHGESENILDFFTEDIKTWRLNQKPIGARNPGLNFETGGNSKLFLERSSGNLGLSTTTPTAKLHVELGELRVRASHNQPTAEIGAFYAENLTQGIGIGQNQIAAIGSNDHQDIQLIPKGTGQLSITSPLHVGGNLTVRGLGTYAFAGNLTVNGTSGRNYFKDAEKNDGAGLRVGAVWGMYGIYAETGRGVLGGADGVSFQNNQVVVSNTGDLAVAGTASFTGNVGIGTPATEQRLAVKDGNIEIDGGTELCFSDNGQIRSADDNHRILFRRTEDILELREYGKIVFSPGARSGEATEKVVIQSSGDLTVKGAGESSFAGNLSIAGTLSVTQTSTLTGNVGIGAGPGSEKLKVMGDTSISGTLAFGAAVRQMLNLWAQEYGIGVQGSTQYFRTGKNFAWYKGGSHHNSELNAGGGTVQMVIKDGKVGIGTNNPDLPLRVTTGISGNWQARFTNSNSNVYLAHSGGYGIHINTGGTNNSGRYAFEARNRSQTHLYVRDDGYIGVGKTNPGEKLDVYGRLRISSSNNYFRMYLSGTTDVIFHLQNARHGTNRKIRWDGDTNWDSASDFRLKTDIEKEKNILDRLMKLEVKNYRWKDNLEAKIKKIGFVAQDIQPFFPSLVGEIQDEEEDESILTLKYAEFGVLAIGGLKELKIEKDTEIAKIKEKTNTEIKKINAEIKKIKTQLQKLEN